MFYKTFDAPLATIENELYRVIDELKMPFAVALTGGSFGNPALRRATEDLMGKIQARTTAQDIRMEFFLLKKYDAC